MDKDFIKNNLEVSRFSFNPKESISNNQCSPEDFNFYLTSLPLPYDSESARHSMSGSFEGDSAQPFDFTLSKQNERKESKKPTLDSDTMMQYEDLEYDSRLQRTVREFEDCEMFRPQTPQSQTPIKQYDDLARSEKHFEFLSPYEPSTTYSEKPKFLSTGYSLQSLHIESASEVDVLCINCYECIPADSVDSHSSVCFKPVLEETSNCAVEIRVRKLLNSIRLKKQDAYGDVLLVLIDLEEYAQAILDASICSYTLLDKLDSLVKTCMLMRDGLSCSIFAKRLIHLIELKGPFESAIKSICADKIKIYEEEMARQRQELERWKLRSEILLELVDAFRPQGVNEIRSDMGSETFTISSVYSKATEYTEQKEEKQSSHSLTEEELEKYFYSICIRKKMSFSKNHPARDIIICHLYDKCKRENIPVALWDDFIDENLQNAK
ncbi:unnamed protein product [Blepharisma stoltei]|uniref:Uncharacterized protein n=1 Tax=Blepharisma stoltei TaxID=1481888 RepID=A0AAU9JVL8_9CILI|nr:unnamed protein product [Blepharisma stoltei]